MGGALSGLFGSQSSSQQSSSGSSAGGYGALPAFDQQAIQKLITNAGDMLSAPNGANIFTPLPQTASETTAQGLAQPMTQQSVTNMANTYMNPYQQFLTNAINQNAQQGNSLYQNQVAGSGFAAGTTNRDFLNEGYATGQQDQAIGQSLANNYGAALDTGLGQQNKNVSQLMGIGQNQRAITAGTNQAPVTALQALAQLMNTAMPATTTSTNSSQGTSSSQDNSGSMSDLGNSLGTAAKIASFFM